MVSLQLHAGALLRSPSKTYSGPLPWRTAVITCLKCGKENQDHYKFCLGCGAELPRAAAAKPFTAATPPQGVPAVGAAPAPVPMPMPGPSAPPPPVAPPPAPPPVAARPPSGAPAGASATVTCPQCGHVNGTGHRFCASCGYNLGALAGASPSAAPPAAAPIASAYPQ